MGEKLATSARRRRATATVSHRFAPVAPRRPIKSQKRPLLFEVLVTKMILLRLTPALKPNRKCIRVLKDFGIKLRARVMLKVQILSKNKILKNSTHSNHQKWFSMVFHEHLNKIHDFWIFGKNMNFGNSVLRVYHNTCMRDAKTKVFDELMKSWVYKG